MATTIQNIEVLREYLTGVLYRANHHAQNVNNHSTASIEVRDNSTQGNVIHIFNNSTPLIVVKAFFENL